MENNTNNEMNQEAMIRAIQAAVKVSRWVYESAVDEGFSPDKAFAMSLAYFTGIMQITQGKSK